ncbi:hypothetical protein [Streptomyces syringium]|uniref:hypothetical protein n=1 Tax=Streptomyces syringium TaxID=76729 RepID=UPI00342BF9DA
MMFPRLIAGTPRVRYAAADALVKLALSPLYAPVITALRRELRLRHRFTGDALIPSARRHTDYYGFSSALLPDRMPLPAAHKTVGIWQPAQPPNWRPDDRLTDSSPPGPHPCISASAATTKARGEVVPDHHAHRPQAQDPRRGPEQLGRPDRRR